MNPQTLIENISIEALQQLIGLWGQNTPMEGQPDNWAHSVDSTLKNNFWTDIIKSIIDDQSHFTTLSHSQRMEALNLIITNKESLGLNSEFWNQKSLFANIIKNYNERKEFQSIDIDVINILLDHKDTIELDNKFFEQLIFDLSEVFKSYDWNN
jgi:hypothetical protein